MNKYLNRIHYNGKLSPTIDVLNHLHKAHILNIPFENLDIHYGNKIVLDINKIYEKIVLKNRGGFCYELNGLFQTLLEYIGFDSKMISARVYSDNGEFGQEFDHMALIVKINNDKYLVDVGFGEFIFNPLKIEKDTIQTDPRGDFIVEEYTEKSLKVSKIESQKKIVKYIFTEKNRCLEEFTEMCDYHQTNPNSHFTQNELISKPTENGRITIKNKCLKITKNNILEIDKKLSHSEYKEELLKWFNIEYNKIKAQ